MTMKHFDTDFFAEIINGMTKTCEGLEVQQLLSAATKIYLAGNEAMKAVKECICASWRVWLERRRNMGFGISALAQGQVCQRPKWQACADLRHTQLTDIHTREQGCYCQWPEGLHCR